jgi:glutathione S-transferase
MPEPTPAITIYAPDFSTIRLIACSPPDMGRAAHSGGEAAAPHPADALLRRWRAPLGRDARLEPPRNGSEWAAGDVLSLADLIVFVYVATAVQLGLDLPERYPSLTRVYEAMRDRPSARATWPSTWKDRLDSL